jgi:nitroreductase
MMNFLDLVSKRQSDRAYELKPVEIDKINYILEAARLAPSACNAQPWKIIVVDNVDIKNKIADATSNRVLGMNHFTKQAPVHFVVVEENANFTSSFGSWAKKKHFPHIDLGILAEHICLAATEQGLGTCMVGWFDEKKVKNILGIPQSKKAVLIITLGYSAQSSREKRRKNLSEIISWNCY